jgi:hypothetical protein
MDEVIKQCPQNIDKEKIEAIFIKNNENVLDTLIELWEIDDKKNSDPDAPEFIVSIDDGKDVEKKKWNNIRDICDSFDTEMTKYMKK